MASFLMIHGAWHGGWCFDRLRAPLEAAGHVMIAPDLPGIGGDAPALAAVSLQSWADFIVKQSGKLTGPVILCGHSRGGIVMSQAAEQAPDAFAGLVYISGALIPDRRSLYDVIGAAMARDAFGAALSPVAEGLGLRFSPEAAATFFYNRCAPEDQKAYAARLVVEPVRPLGTPLRLHAERFGRVARHYVECAHDNTFPLDVQRAMQAALPCESVTALESDHSPFIGMPDRLAGVLIKIAGAVEKGGTRERNEP